MFINTINDKTVNVKITRKELIDLMLLCSSHYDDTKKWEVLHNKLSEQLNAHDEKMKKREDNTK